jgi:hypothetical protein
MAEADDHLYRSKKAGRNRTALADEQLAASAGSETELR